MLIHPLASYDNKAMASRNELLTSPVPKNPTKVGERKQPVDPTRFDLIIHIIHVAEAR